jgi:putative autoinducer-2 (AI-2) aldolase
VIAGGKKLPEKEALELAYNAMRCGARGVDMGRNIFQSECPIAMVKSISKIVHEHFNAKTAYEFYLKCARDYKSEIDFIEPKR